LGTYTSEFKLQQARQACREARALLNDGADPKVELENRKKHQESERRRIESESRATSVNEILDHYLTTLTNENTLKNTKTQFQSDVRPLIGKVKALELTEEQAETVIQRVVDRGSQRSARNLHIALNSAFNIAIKKRAFGLREWTNPYGLVEKPAAGTPHDRALNIEQLRTFWNALEEFQGMGEPLKDIIRLLLLTGQRVQEIVGLQWAEIDLNESTIDIPPARIKTGKVTNRGHVVPITPMARDILIRQPRLGTHVFPSKSDDNKPINWQSLTTALARLLKEHEELPKFSPRDIRSTVKTHMARIKVMKEIRDRIQNHALTDVADKHYDRYDYLDEKRFGLNKWEIELKSLISQAPDS